LAGQGFEGEPCDVEVVVDGFVCEGLDEVGLPGARRSGQCEVLRGLIGRFRLRDVSGGGPVKKRTAATPGADAGKTEKAGLAAVLPRGPAAAGDIADTEPRRGAGEQETQAAALKRAETERDAAVSGQAAKSRRLSAAPAAKDRPADDAAGPGYDLQADFGKY